MLSFLTFEILNFKETPPTFLEGAISKLDL